MVGGQTHWTEGEKRPRLACSRNKEEGNNGGKELVERTIGDNPCGFEMRPTWTLAPPRDDVFRNIFENTGGPVPRLRRCQKRLWLKRLRSGFGSREGNSGGSDVCARFDFVVGILRTAG